MSLFAASPSQPCHLGEVPSIRPTPDSEVAESKSRDIFDHRVSVLSPPNDAEDLRRVLQESLGLNHVDSGIALAHVPGVLLQRFTPGQARHVVEVIARTGATAVAVPGCDIPDFDHPETVHRLRCRSIGLEVADVDGEVGRTFVWGNLRLVSIGRVPLDESRTYTTDTILRTSPVPQDMFVTTGRRERLECWLVFVDPLQVIRFDSGHMYYEQLDADVPTSGTVNFEVLAGILLKHAQFAHVTPAARAYCNHSPVIQYDFSSSEALRQYSLVEYLRDRMNVGD